MSRGSAAVIAVLLAFLSGIPALIYQVVWTRQVGLIASGQIEAISVVLVAFFGGLAIGNHVFGAHADRTPSALRLYAFLEFGAAILAMLSVWALGLLAEQSQLGSAWLLSGSALVLLPTTVLLGGTLPALLRWVVSDPETTPARSGVLICANTAGAVVGVGCAVAAIPLVGLRMSLLAGALLGLAIGCAALVFARPGERVPSFQARATPIEARVLAAAFLVGVATLGFEVLAARLATLRIGSSLYAWGLVLALFLVGLAMGNLAASRRARTSASPALDLGWIELAAAGSVALGIAALAPDYATPSAALNSTSIARVALAVLPGTFCMGAAFPFLVRLAIGDAQIGRAFGRVSAMNTLGGILGALLAPFVLLPMLGSTSAALTLAAVNGGIGIAFLASTPDARHRTRAVLALAVLALAFAPALIRQDPVEDPWVLFVAEGRQASVAVTSSSGHRTLYVDGDPEASTAGNARETEELLAVLPILLHPDPERYLEIGLGSGITLGTATRFPLEELDCVEIADSVIQAARLFEPDNLGIADADRHDDRVRIVHDDARRFLASRLDRYDVVSANTLHPWSIGATGLYSREYFARIAAALRTDGIVVQWLPTQQIGSESLSLILRTFFDVFPEGGLWWGAGNVIALGSLTPMAPFRAPEAEARLDAIGFDVRRLGWRSLDELPAYRIGSADAVRRALGSGLILEDDRPLLEFHAAQGRIQSDSGALWARLVEMAESNERGDGMRFWLESLELRARGDESGANAREHLAADLGLALAERAGLDRRVEVARRDALAARWDLAASGFEDVLRRDPEHRHARLGRAGISMRRGDLAGAIANLELLVARWPGDARVWTELANAYARNAEPARARTASRRAVEANPFDVRILANAGLMAAKNNDRERARSMLNRIRALSPLGQSSSEKALAEVLARIDDP